jgi:hypothetical protein
MTTTDTDTCADCGGPNAVVHCTDGHICLPCQDNRNEALGELARTLGPVCQPIDPDGPPIECGMADCGRDATYITRLPDGRGVTACDEHIPAMARAVAKIITATAQPPNRRERRGRRR